MWMWLSIAVLVRVLLASNEAEFQVGNLDGQQQQRQQIMLSDSRNAELSGETSRPTIVPIENTDQLLCKNAVIFQGGGDPASGVDGSALYNGKVPLYASLNIGELASILENGKSIKFLSKNDEDNDKKGKRSPQEFGNLNSPPRSWISLTNLGDKIPGLFQEPASIPSQEIRKSRAFSPWGGKRVAVLGQGSKVRRPIRVPFNSWGGKRGFDLEEKLEGNENELVEKRTKFNAWGGKRSKNGERDEEEIKRTRFNAWGGKRSDITEKRTPEEVFAKKRVFNAWGGKRFATQGKTGLGEDDVYNRLIERGNEVGVNFESLGSEGEGRVAQPGLREVIGSSGGGKYVEEEAVDPEVSFGGEIMVLPNKRGGGKHFQRSYFNPWGGRKRNPQEKGAASMRQPFPPVATDSEGLDRQVHLSSWEG